MLSLGGALEVWYTYLVDKWVIALQVRESFLSHSLASWIPDVSLSRYVCFDGRIRLAEAFISLEHPQVTKFWHIVQLRYFILYSMVFNYSKWIMSWSHGARRLVILREQYEKWRFKVFYLCCRIWLVSTSRCMSFLERLHFLTGDVLSQHPLIRLQFHGDNQILKLYAASERLVLEVPWFHHNFSSFCVPILNHRMSM